MEDLIRRQDAIDALDKRFDAIPMEQTTEILLLRRDLRDLPSATCDDCIWHSCNYNKVDWDGENDYISRQAAIDALIADGRNVDSRYLESERVIHESDAVEAISMLPSADRPRGEWISDRLYRLYTTNGGSYGVYRCSVCESYYPDIVSTWNYCPHCGADMRGEKDG